MIVNIISSSRYKLERNKIKNRIEAIIAKENRLIFSSLNLIFVGKRKIKAIAEKYKKESIALPILTFYYHEKNIGEIFVCYPQMILLAAEKNKTIDYILNFLIKHAIDNLIKQKSSNN